MAEGCYGGGMLWLRDAMVEVYYMAGQTMAEDDYTEKLMAGRTWLWRARMVAAGEKAFLPNKGSGWPAL